MEKTLDKRKHVEFFEDSYQRAKNLHQELKEIYVTNKFSEIVI